MDALELRRKHPRKLDWIRGSGFQPRVLDLVVVPTIQTLNEGESSRLEAAPTGAVATKQSCIRMVQRTNKVRTRTMPVQKRGGNVPGDDPSLMDKRLNSLVKTMQSQTSVWLARRLL